VIVRDDAGSGTVLGLAVIGSILAVIAVSLPLYIGLSIKQSLLGAADASALAGADVAIGIVGGSPCDVASRLAVTNGATLDACAVDGLVVTVRTKRDFLGLELTASATAGPPDAGTN
jgi:secretion/DNA translocation related TadE-like protein